MSFPAQGKTNWKYILIVLILTIIVGGGSLWFSGRERISPSESPGIKKSREEGEITKPPIVGSNKSPNMAIDSQGNLYIVWVSGEESNYDQYLYFKKLAPSGKTLIGTQNLGNIGRLLTGPEVVIDSQNNIHVFTGNEIVKSANEGMIIQHLIVKNSKVVFKREIKRGDETRDPLVGVDKDGYLYLIYSVWNATKDNRGVTINWDIRYYFEKINSRGESLIGPIEIKYAPTFHRIVIDDNNFYFVTAIDSRNREVVYKYIEMDKNGNLVKLLDSPVKFSTDIYFGGGIIRKKSIAVLKKDSLLFCFDDSCTVDSNNNVYYFYSSKKNIESPQVYLQYKEFNKSGEPIKEDKIIEVTEVNPHIFDIRAYTSEDGNMNIIYYINDGLNNFSVFYSKIDVKGKVIIEKLEIS